MIPTAVATRRHTAILVLIFAGLGIAGNAAGRSGALQGAALTGQQTLQMYLSVVLIEWASVYYVWRGIRRHTSLRTLIGGRWARPADVAIDLAAAIMSWVVWLGIQALLPSSNDVQRLLPHGFIQAAAWIPVAVSAGVCEEIVFRGYLQRQFHVFSGSLVAAIGAQALVFAFGHFYEGAWAVAEIAIYGALLGAVAAARRSVRPGMLAHVWSDLFGVVIFTP